MSSSGSNIGLRAALGFALLVIGPGAQLLPLEAAEPASRPNVLMLVVDDLTCSLGCYGDRVARSPAIDRLARQGVRFDRAYNQIPLCNPSRASVLTGLRPDQTTVFDLDRHFRDQLPRVVTLPQAFRQAGYYAARIGKVYHYDVPAGIGTNGLDDPPSWHEVINPRGRDVAEEALIFNAQPQRKISAALSWLAAEGDDREQTDGMIADEAMGFLQRNTAQPFFLAVGFFRPHTPYVAPKAYFAANPLSQLRLPYAPDNDRNDLPLAALAHNCYEPHYGLPEPTLLSVLQAYYACVAFVDAQIGRVLDQLEQSGLADRTIVVLWSDHGYHLGEHRGIWQKRTLFEAAARTPLIVRAPGRTGNGHACARVVELVDLYPTLAALAQVDVPAGLAGRDLSPLLDDPDQTWDGAAVTQILRPADARLSQPVMGRSVRTERYRFTEWNAGRAGRELYDYHADPGEFQNLAIDPTTVDRDLMETLRQRFVGRASGEVPATPWNPARL